MLTISLLVFLGIIISCVGLVDSIALMQIILIACVGWLMIILAHALGGKSFESMTKAATLFACLYVAAGALNKFILAVSNIIKKIMPILPS